MARLFWMLLIFAFFGALITGASWAAAYTSVGQLLGAPPPRMGKQTITIHWDGMSRLIEHPPWWRFAFAPTAIPGAAQVRIRFSPAVGRATELSVHDPDLVLTAQRIAS